MARGGYRPGAGRPKGAKTATPERPAKVSGDVRKAAKAARKTPLEYMLDIMNDDEADGGRRDRMAIAAAPFVHARAAEQEPGKKDRQAAAAQKAAQGRFAPPAPPKLVVDNR